MEALNVFVEELTKHLCGEAYSGIHREIARRHSGGARSRIAAELLNVFTVELLAKLEGNLLRNIQLYS